MCAMSKSSWVSAKLHLARKLFSLRVHTSLLMVCFGDAVPFPRGALTASSSPCDNEELKSGEEPSAYLGKS